MRSAANWLSNTAFGIYFRISRKRAAISVRSRSRKNITCTVRITAAACIPKVRRKGGLMSNILDYLDWRGDLTLDASPFCEVDNLILTQLSFADLDGIADGADRRESVPLSAAVERYFENEGRRLKSRGALIPDEVPELLRRAAESRRFRDMGLVRFDSVMDKTVQTQFAALCILLGDGSFYISYRGTDDTLIGWKEDLNMGFMEQVPAQEHARAYLEAAAKKTARRYSDRRALKGEIWRFMRLRTLRAVCRSESYACTTTMAQVFPKVLWILRGIRLYASGF